MVRQNQVIRTPSRIIARKVWENSVLNWDILQTSLSPKWTHSWNQTFTSEMSSGHWIVEKVLVFFFCLFGVFLCYLCVCLFLLSSVFREARKKSGSAFLGRANRRVISELTNFPSQRGKKEWHKVYTCWLTIFSTFFFFFKKPIYFNLKLQENILCIINISIHPFYCYTPWKGRKNPLVNHVVSLEKPFSITLGEICFYKSLRRSWERLGKVIMKRFLKIQTETDHNIPKQTVAAYSLVPGIIILPLLLDDSENKFWVALLE